MRRRQPPIWSLTHPLYQGSVGAIVGAIVGAVLGAVLGLFVGNSGVASGVLPGSPTATQTVAVPGPTVTVPGPTVTATESDPSETTHNDPSDVEAVHLADAASRPEDILVDPEMFDQSNIGINGKTFDSGWAYTQSVFQRPSIIMGINLNQSYSTFKARLGVQSTSQVSSAKLALIADGVTVFEKTVSLGRSYDVNLSMSKVQRLEIKAFQPRKNDIRFAVGDPRVMP